MENIKKNKLKIFPKKTLNESKIAFFIWIQHERDIKQKVLWIYAANLQENAHAKVRFQ